MSDSKEQTRAAVFRLHKAALEEAKKDLLCVLASLQSQMPEEYEMGTEAAGYRRIDSLPLPLGATPRPPPRV